ncbi:VPA1269 family protein [Vibrio crassostreae]|uniref:VPA1269 family protein n=1 Tax=Vibrio crassostreae TaxID=246167 RepID=UPI00119ACC97|nr:VPA1269 family protein [Vibrio crassostreae]TWD65291.1 putative integrase [Vibrio crassostreae]
MLGLKSTDVEKFLEREGEVEYLSNSAIIEVCLVCLTNKNEYERGLKLLSTLRDRGICFSEFYYFAKHQWSTAYLTSLSIQAKKQERISSLYEEFDKAAEANGYGVNSSPRQKGRVFALLYGYFYEKHSLMEVTLEDVDKLRCLVIDRHALFTGDINTIDHKYIKKELFGILEFLIVGYRNNNQKLDSKLETDIIPNGLSRPRGLSLSRSKRKSEVRLENYSFLISEYERYKDTLKLKNPKEVDAALRVLLEYICNRIDIMEVKSVEDFQDLMKVGRDGEYRWFNFLNEGEKKIRSKALAIFDFANWLMIEHAIDQDDGYEALLSRVEYDKVIRLVKNDGNGAKDETPKALIPYRVHQIATDILYDPSYEWARSLDYMYFRDEEGVNTFNPTIVNLLALLFMIPIRGIQAQCLDSGEGDPYKYNFDDVVWEENDSKLACYWKAKGHVNDARGFLNRAKSLVREAKKSKEFDDSGYPIIRRAYMYVNTNKTADRNVAFSDSSGYVIPWHHEDVIKIVERQLKFIEEHHPVDSPSCLRDLEKKDLRQILGAPPTKLVLKLIPDRFYLFRCNLNPVKNTHNFPPTKKLLVRTWNNLMIEIQRRLEDEGADFSVISADKIEKFKKNIGGGNSYISDLTIHCTRVTGITRLEEAGVPINIISKFIAGHANIRTTYHYVKHDAHYVETEISEAQAKVSMKMQLSLSSDLKKKPISKARAMAYISDAYDSSWEIIRDRAWNSNTLGICPNAATLCDEAHQDSDFRFKGVGKCANCKYLVSGKPYLITIWSHINTLLYKAKKISDTYNQLQEEQKELVKLRRQEYKTNGKTELFYSYDNQVKKVENHMESNEGDENLILAEVYYTNLLFEKVREVTNTEDDFVGGLGFEECSDFEHLNSIVESERFLPHFTKDKDLKFKRDTFVDMALVALGEQPLFLKPLSDDERQAAISSTAKAIEHDLQKLEGKYLGAVMKIQNLGDITCLPQ